VSHADCIFCRIARGEIPAEVVQENSGAVAFLDVQPLADGHVVVVPRAHVARVEELQRVDAEALFRLVAAVAGPVRQALGAEGTTIGINDGEITGQTIPHVHIHIVPRHRDDGAGSIHSMFRAGERRPVADVAATIRKKVGAAS
jgi:histidine triad (HIT) family protein